MTISTDNITLLANDELSVLRAFETLSQLVIHDSEGFRIKQVPMQIYDKPAFGYRGLMIDTARRYYSVDMIRRIIDVLMQLKMNALHWHLTDNEGFTLGSVTHPEVNHPQNPTPAPPVSKSSPPTSVPTSPPTRSPTSYPTRSPPTPSPTPPPARSPTSPPTHSPTPSPTSSTTRSPTSPPSIKNKNPATSTKKPSSPTHSPASTSTNTTSLFSSLFKSLSDPTSTPTSLLSSLFKSLSPSDSATSLDSRKSITKNGHKKGENPPSTPPSSFPSSPSSYPSSSLSSSPSRSSHSTKESRGIKQNKKEGSTTRPETNNPRSPTPAPPPVSKSHTRGLVPPVQPNEKMPNPKFYTHEEIQEIVEYAKVRGIRVIPEIDIPAHTHSWAYAFDSITVPGSSAQCSQINPLDITNPLAYKLIEDFMTEEESLFSDPFVHLGGDEVSYSCLGENKEFMRKLNDLASRTNISSVLPAYWKLFWSSLLPIFNRTHPGKTPIIWDEWIDEAKGSYLGWDPIIEIWRGTSNLFEATKQGFEVINAYGWYLNPAPEGCTSWRDCYNHHPYYYIELGAKTSKMLSEQQKNLVLGGEAPVWEQSEQCFHERVWDRLTAISERLWSNPIREGQVTLSYGPNKNCWGKGKFEAPSGNGGSRLGERFDSQIARMWKRNNIQQWYQGVYTGENCGC